MQNLLKTLTANYKAEVKGMKRQVKKDLKQAQKAFLSEDMIERTISGDHTTYRITGSPSNIY